MKKRMKKKVILGIFAIVVLFVAAYCMWKVNSGRTLSDAALFAGEYTQVTEDNVFVYRDVDEVLDLMRSGTGIVYLGYPECHWCQAYVRYLNEAAKEAGVSVIYYCNTKEVKENNMDKYYELIALLDGHLQYTETGEQWIYVPNVSFHVNGEIIGNDYETSKDTHDLTEPADYWTEGEVRDLKQTLKGYMEQVLEATK